MGRNLILNLSNVQQFQAINVLSDPGSIGGPKLIPSCYQVSIRWGNDAGKQPHNVMYGRYSTLAADPVASANAIMTALSTNAQWTALAAFLSNFSSIQAVLLRDVNTANQPIFSSTVSAQPGTSASPALPNEVAVAVTLRTAFAGRSGRGRIFIPNYSTNALGAGNVVAAAAVTATQNWAATITGAFAAQGLTFVLGLPDRAAYTGKTGTQHPARTRSSTPITSVVVRDNHWDTQRRRGLK